jgi:hypothetical protein
MNNDNMSAEQLIHELAPAGRYPHPDLVNAIWDRRSETEPLLLDLFQEAYEDARKSENDPRLYRFVHAGKFLLSWQNLDALPIFAHLYKDDAMQDWCEWFEEDLFHFGLAAIPHLQQVIIKEGDGRWHYGQALSGSILTKIATYYPETRDEVTAIFRAQLPPEDKIPTLTEANEIADELWGNWAAELAELADEASRDQILALADADLLSPEFFSRQHYLQDMNRGFRPQKPPQPYDIRDDYYHRFESHQERARREEREQQRQHESRVRAATPRSGPKIGRNDPCPCGSGKKYKKCHGRPGA